MCHDERFCEDSRRIIELSGNWRKPTPLYGALYRGVSSTAHAAAAGGGGSVIVGGSQGPNFAVEENCRFYSNRYNSRALDQQGIGALHGGCGGGGGGLYHLLGGAAHSDPELSNHTSPSAPHMMMHLDAAYYHPTAVTALPASTASIPSLQHHLSQVKHACN